MEFVYTARDASGRRVEERISAASRAEAFAILKEKGITPISLKIVDKATEDRCEGLKPKTVVLGALSVIGVLIIGLTVWCLNSKSVPVAKSVVVVPQNTAPSTPTKHIVRKTNPVAEPVVTQTIKTVHSGPKTAKEVLADLLAHPPSVTNYMVGITITTNRPKMLFKNATEQMLAALFHTELGSMPPPMPRMPMRDKVDIQEILSSSFSLSPDDTEKSAMVKETVAQAKKAMKEYLDKGGTPEGFIDHYRNELDSCYQMWKMSQQMAIKSCREEDPEIAREMVEKINDSLAAKGIKQVNLPPKFREKLGLK